MSNLIDLGRVASETKTVEEGGLKEDSLKFCPKIPAGGAQY